MPALTFLSAEWLDAFDHALRGARIPETGDTFVLEQVVVGVPGRGEVRYCITFENGSARVETGPPDVRFTTDYETAIGIATGRANAQRALARGRLQIGGDLEVFTTHMSLFLALNDVTAALRSDTDFLAP